MHQKREHQNHKFFGEIHLTVWKYSGKTDFYKSFTLHVVLDVIMNIFSVAIRSREQSTTNNTTNLPILLY